MTVLEQRITDVALAPSPFAEDVVGERYVTFRGSIEIEDKRGQITAHARTVRFITTQFTDWRLNTVNILVESPDRPRDTLDVPSPPNQSLSVTLGTMIDYIVDQERRIQEGGTR